MTESIVQFAFQNPMFPFQFSEMRLNCHSNLLGRIQPQIRSETLSLHEPQQLSMGQKTASIIFAGFERKHGTRWLARRAGKGNNSPKWDEESV
jgi:hypothetical protein